MIYRVVCERLETMDHVTDAVECFNQMTSELGGEMNLHGEHLEWALGKWSRIPCRCRRLPLFCVRIQAAFLEEIGASRRYSSGFPAIR